MQGLGERRGVRYLVCLEVAKVSHPARREGGLLKTVCVTHLEGKGEVGRDGGSKLSESILSVECQEGL